MRQKTSIATVCLSGDLEEKLVAIQRAGFDGIEIFEQDFIGSHLRPEDVRQMVADHGLEITLFQPFRDFEGLPKGALRDRAFSRAKYKFEVMQRLGTDLVLICSSTHPEALGGIARMADDFAELGEIARDAEVRVGFEALAWGRFIYDHRDAWEVVRRANHPNVGLILDSFHSLVRKIETDSIRNIPPEKIFFVQLADAPAIEMDYLYHSRHFRNMPGEGDLEVGRFIQAIQQTGYQGPLSLEIFNDQFRRSDTELVARDGYRALVHLMDGVNRLEGAAEASLLPEKVQIGHLEYIECVIPASDLAYYRQFFEQIGFGYLGRHKTKNVHILGQAGLNLLLNCEPSYLLAEEGEAFGLMVSEIAFHVPDANAALKRAVALGTSEAHLQKSDAEAGFPALKGAGKTILRLIDANMDIWATDFDFSRDDACQKENTLLNKIDHIAQTMSYDEMLSWTLFYTTLFDMEKTPLVDVVDPDGIIKSQVIHSPDNGVCLTLNGSDAMRTRASDFITTSPGATVQHIAFATEDIFKIAGHLNGLDGAVLPQTANYYEDIQARFGLTSEVLERLKARNILYDEDEKGQFYHFYCHLEQTNMFFEFVQRIEGYKGFGAANAPFRLAAQRRLARRRNLSKAS